MLARSISILLTYKEDTDGVGDDKAHDHINCDTVTALRCHSQVERENTQFQAAVMHVRYITSEDRIVKTYQKLSVTIKVNEYIIWRSD